MPQPGPLVTVAGDVEATEVTEVDAGAWRVVGGRAVVVVGAGDVEVLGGCTVDVGAGDVGRTAVLAGAVGRGTVSVGVGRTTPRDGTGSGRTST